jgi:branched-chain amino acid aminotransferase
VTILADGGMNLSIDSGRPRVGIAAWAWADYHGEGATRGIRLNVSSYTRHHPGVMPVHAKVSGNYVNSFLAKTEASRLGFDDAVLLDTEGYVSECTGANLFLVRDGRISTPPLDSVLNGITRDTVLALAGDLGVPVREERIVRDRLYSADEIFVCGTAAEVVGVREIDWRPVSGGGVGPVTSQILDLFRSVVRGEHARSAAWLSPVRRSTDDVGAVGSGAASL